MKFLLWILSILLLLAILLWSLFWIYGRKQFSVSYGISFNQQHATSLGLDWKVVYEDMLKELHPSYVRIAAMWSSVEETEGTFDYADVDWMMDTAKQYNTKVLLVVGQKAPRWPECYIPTWVAQYGAEEREARLLDYVKTTVERYTSHDALETWQVENEAFIRFVFGECEGFQKASVQKEIDLVRELDPGRKIVLTDSGELATWHKPSKLGDILGTTMYRIVRTPSGKIVSYDWLPAGFYRLKARLWGKSYDQFFVAELQAEPWFMDATPLDTPVSEMEQTMTPERLIAHLDYASHVGASRVYLWGVEWWYYMKEAHGDARYWDTIRDVLNPHSE